MSICRLSLGLVGDARIAHSPSPAIHDAIFGDDTYTLRMADDDDAAAAAVFVAAERALRGINVTAPHKQRAARRYADVLDADACRAGAVNTVVYGDDHKAVLAANTDVRGLLVAWHRASIIVKDRTVALVGSGGAARAVVVAALDAGAGAVVVHARRDAAAAALVDVATALGVSARVADGSAEARGDVVVLAAADLDDVGAWLARCARPAAVVHELRYGPRAIASRNAALRSGHLFVDGTSMLLAQAEAAAAHFAGRALSDAERDAARRALVGVLRG